MASWSCQRICLLFYVGFVTLQQPIRRACMSALAIAVIAQVLCNLVFLILILFLWERLDRASNVIQSLSIALKVLTPAVNNETSRVVRLENEIGQHLQAHTRGATKLMEVQLVDDGN